jgi:uncharacterized cysteine cluster protein YcgN (CxxCxxCC family)
MDCSGCPVQGKCCHINMKFMDFNITLDHVFCPYLDLETGLCKDYDHRQEHFWCLPMEQLKNTGALPEECLYLKKNPSLEENPRISIFKALEVVDEAFKNQLLGQYNICNNIPFETYLKYAKKQEVIPNG